MTHSK